jgi:hypothetical protein
MCVEPELTWGEKEPHTLAINYHNISAAVIDYFCSQPVVDYAASTSRRNFMVYLEWPRRLLTDCGSCLTWLLVALRCFANFVIFSYNLLDCELQTDCT